VIIGLLSLAVMITWPSRFHHILPAPLAALIIGTSVSLFVLTGAPVIGNVPTGLPEIHWPFTSLDSLPSILQPALTLALLGSIDSLLTSLVADSITHTRHNSNRELVGQGIGNMFAGLIGGLPGAGATMRTVVNVRAGGRSPVSGALHALVLLALVMGLGPLAENIPHAVLAGILMKIGWDIIDWSYLRHALHAPRDKVLVMLVTLGLTVFVDLVTAVAVGLILAGFVTAKWMEKEELKGITAIALPQEDQFLNEKEKAALMPCNGQISIVHLRGRFSYASAREMVQQVNALNFGHKAIIYDFSGAAHMDTSAALAIEELFLAASSETVGCYACGLSGVAEETLDSLGVLDVLPEDHIAPDLLAAIHKAAADISG